MHQCYQLLALGPGVVYSVNVTVFNVMSRKSHFHFRLYSGKKVVLNKISHCRFFAYSETKCYDKSLYDFRFTKIDLKHYFFHFCTTTCGTISIENTHFINFSDVDYKLSFGAALRCCGLSENLIYACSKYRTQFGNFLIYAPQ
jgi:hypothetical protein